MTVRSRGGGFFLVPSPSGGGLGWGLFAARLGFGTKIIGCTLPPPPPPPRGGGGGEEGSTARGGGGECSLRGELAPCDFACSDVVWYGLMWSSTRPGVSTLVESIWNQPSGLLRWMKAVPRTSVIWSTGSFAASRCAISTIARSALPYSRMSHFESTAMERRTLSDQ